MFKVLAFAVLALASAQTTTDGPRVPKNFEVAASFAGDCATFSAAQQATLISEFNAAVAGFFDAETVETTLSCGSIIATARVTGGFEPAVDGGLQFSSATFGAATVAYVEIAAPTVVFGGSGNRYSGEMGKAGKGMGKSGKGMAGEAGKAGKAGKGMAGEAGKGMGSGKGEAGKGTGSGKGEAGKGKGSESGYMHRSMDRAISSDTIATLSAGIVLVAGVSLLAVRRHRQSRFNGEYELQIDANDIEVVIPTEDTPLVV
jgi:hypothetical protein